ncbi:hypothetical protein CBR_g70173 [Chara braunii]|uniref:Reverse transcriptase/retrotransposon-derived protein RNase H-like domain-containing protein n=1 Tax=Chara braunii TaxID=69332 RepID=A0A388MFT5_CHABU|nr:hypothetical protein CBR_g70173 [Chara braunii]|eukprot:GBG93438.1 hypothetical protein CBR_g70173 [Chara braunii]
MRGSARKRTGELSRGPRREEFRERRSRACATVCHAVLLEEGFDVERMVDKLLEGHNDLMNLKDILASAPRLRGELKGRLLRRLVPNVHLSSILPREIEWTEAGIRMDWKCVACGLVDLKVLGLLEEHNLTASGPKSKHCMREATIMGFVCNEKGRRPDVKKTDKILEWSVLFQLITDVRSFLGTCGFWRSFVKDFATKTEHLRKLVRKDEEWVWGEDQEKAVERMKGEFKEGVLVLGAPNYEATEERPFVVETDAGPTALGGVLIQTDVDGKERPLRSDFSKAAMQRGGRDTRPRQGPQRVPGRGEQHEPPRRKPTSEFNGDNIEFFLDVYLDHAAQRGWSVAERIHHLRGIGWFEEPVAQICEEALTWPDVEAGMQRLRASPRGRDVEPTGYVSLEEPLDPEMETDMRDRDEPQDLEMAAEQPDPVRAQDGEVITVGDDTPPCSPIPEPAQCSWPEEIPEPGSEEIPEFPPETTAVPEQEAEMEEQGADEGARMEAIHNLPSVMPTTERPTIDEPVLEGLLPALPCTSERVGAEASTPEGQGPQGRGASRETREQKSARVRVRLDKIHRRQAEMEAAGIEPTSPVDPKTSKQRINKLWARYESQRDAARQRSRGAGQADVEAGELREMGDLGFSATRKAIECVDRKICETAVTSFQWYSLLSGELRVRELEVEHLTTQLAEERARSQAREVEWERRFGEMAAILDRLSEA